LRLRRTQPRAKLTSCADTPRRTGFHGPWWCSSKSSGRVGSGQLRATPSILAPPARPTLFRRPETRLAPILAASSLHLLMLNIFRALIPGRNPSGSVGVPVQAAARPAAALRLPGQEEDCATSSTGTNYRAPASADRACRERQAVHNGPLTHASAGTGSSAGSILSPGAEAGRVSVPRMRAPYKCDPLR
jgi:hypothetical protein